MKSRKAGEIGKQESRKAETSARHNEKSRNQRKKKRRKPRNHERKKTGNSARVRGQAVSVKSFPSKQSSLAFT